jgi:hypothetical protein
VFDLGRWRGELPNSRQHFSTDNQPGGGRHGGSPGTPQGSGAVGRTPSPGPDGGWAGDGSAPTVDTDDELTPGHPALRPWEAECMIQWDAAVDAAESALRFSLLSRRSRLQSSPRPGGADRLPRQGVLPRPSSH